MRPVVFSWKEIDVVDEHGSIERARFMIPIPRYRSLASSQFELNSEYPLVILEARSRASHNFYFAVLSEGFKNLPESISSRWDTVEHFRRWALIECGWFTEKEIDFGTSQYAKRAAILLHDEFDEFARIFQPNNGPKLIVRRAKSQSAAAMAKDAFESSKKDVLDLLASMVGVDTETLKKQAGGNG